MPTCSACLEKDTRNHIVHWQEQKRKEEEIVPQCTACGAEVPKDHIVHEDLQVALRAYSGNRNSFSEMFEEREHEVAQGRIYWCSECDSLYRRIAQVRTERYMKAHPDDPFPKK